MEIMRPPPPPVNGSAINRVRFEPGKDKKHFELVQKALAEKSVSTLERMLVIGAFKFRDFYFRLAELDVAPRLPVRLLDRRPDFHNPDFGRVFSIVADFRDGSEAVEAIGPEMLDVILAGLVEAKRLSVEVVKDIIEWLKPELVEPEWENRPAFFAMLDTHAFREWHRYAVARYELRRLNVMSEAETRLLPTQEIEATLQKILQAGQTARVFPSIVDAADFQAKRLHAPTQIVEGIWHQGGKMSLGGSSKSYKSWLFYDLALAIAFGESWLGFKTSRARVLLVNLEIQEFFSQYRINEICNKRGIRLEPGQLDILNLRGFAASHETLVPRILQRVQQHGQTYGAIILDPIYKLHAAGADENSAVDVGVLMNTVEKLAVQTGAGVAYAAHYSKGNQAGKEAIDRVSGSGTFARDPDTIINITAHENENAFVVDTVLRNLTPVKPFVVRWEFPRMVREPELDPAHLKRPAGRAKTHFPEDLLEVLPPAGLTDGQWQQASGKTESTYKRLKRLLVQAGKVVGENGIWKPTGRPKGPEGLNASFDP